MLARIALVTLILANFSTAASAGTLLVGLEGTSQPIRTSDLAGFPDVAWTNGIAFDVSGAAATPSGEVYLCQGAFTTQIYETDTGGHPPTFLCTSSVDLSGLAFGRGTLYGYSNYADPKGIYAIDTSTGQATLVVDVYTGTGYRFFALDYNPVDDLLYGYTEYGVSGLYSIDLDTGAMAHVADPFPATNTQGRALAVGNNTVYVLATRGDDDIPGFAYDLSQGAGGSWVAFTNPYPTEHATGGAAFIADGLTGITPSRAESGHLVASPNPFNPTTVVRYELTVAAAIELGVYDLAGRLVRTLRQGTLEQPGAHAVTWDGRDGSGRNVPSGTYVCRLWAADVAESIRVSLVR